MNTQKWKFDANITNSFESHINSSIPSLNRIREIISLTVNKDDLVLDIGCSTGIMSQILNCKKYLGIDISKDMIEFAKSNYSSSEFQYIDFFQFSSSLKYQTIISLFTLQFVATEDKSKFLNKVKSLLSDNGIFLIAEKINFADYKHQEYINELYYDFKNKSFSTQEIKNKRRALKQVMFAQTRKANEELYLKSGFSFEILFYDLCFVLYILKV